MEVLLHAPCLQVTFAHAKAQLKRAGRIGTSKKKVLQELDVQACDIKRSDAGRKAIRRILLRVAELDLVHWPDSPCFEKTNQLLGKAEPFFFWGGVWGLCMVLDGVCMSFSSGCLRTCTLKKCSEITWDNFIKNIPFFFQFKYFGLEFAPIWTTCRI